MTILSTSTLEGTDVKSPAGRRPRRDQGSDDRPEFGTRGLCGHRVRWSAGHRQQIVRSADAGPEAGRGQQMLCHGQSNSQSAGNNTMQNKLRLGLMIGLSFVSLAGLACPKGTTLIGGTGALSQRRNVCSGG